MGTLAETQELLWALITAPEGVARALDDPAHGVQRRRLDRTVRSDARLDAVARLDIYANMYFYRLLDVLKDDYPALVAVTGDVVFHNLVTDYLLRHFPTHASLRYAGAHLPEFLADHALAERYPFAGELAAFEWALVDSFDAPDAPSLSRADLAAFRAEEWPTLILRLHPSVQLREFAWPIDRLRRRVDAGEASEEVRAERSRLCIWRYAFQVRHRPLDDLEWRALQALASGAPFAAVCEAVIDVMGETSAAEHAASALARWLDDGLLAAM